MKTYLIKNAQLVNEGKIFKSDVYVKDGFIAQIAPQLQVAADEIIDGTGKYLLPGIIDDQVHFREPGLTHKATIASEARAAVAGGVTSFMEMPNTVPNTVTQALLAHKYEIGARTSLANYSFFMGATNDNLAEVLKTDPQQVCGIKIFMGSSTGNMLVDNRETLEQIFKEAPMLIAVHCEDEATILENQAYYEAQYGEDIPMRCHPEIRSAEACYKSSAMAIALAKKHNTRLHILHISTADELVLFDHTIPLAEKRITAEVCVHHLYFQKEDYEPLGSLLKCNPAIKEKYHQEALLTGLLENKLDIIATDHAPHTWDEKQNKYKKAPSGLPLVQHALPLMLQFYRAGKITLERVVEKMCHAPAVCFQVEKRGFIREGYWADLVLVDLEREVVIGKDNILYQCGWSPLTDRALPGVVTHTLVSGHLAYANGVFNEEKKGERLTFDR